MDKDLRSEKLVRYLDGELTPEEKAGIEQELAADIAFNEEFENLKTARSLIQYEGLRNKVSGIHKEMMKELKDPRKRPAGRIVRYTIAVAASIVLIVGAYLVYNFIMLSSENVFASRYQPYELITLRGNDTTAGTIEKAYREKEYKKVLSIKKRSKQLTAKEQFLSGSAALEIKDYIKAIESFKAVLKDNSAQDKMEWKDEAEYYLALAYIRNKDYDLALDILNTIKSNPQHPYHSRVTKKLLRQVRMLKWR